MNSAPESLPTRPPARPPAPIAPPPRPIFDPLSIVDLDAMFTVSLRVLDPDTTEDTTAEEQQIMRAASECLHFLRDSSTETGKDKRDQIFGEVAQKLAYILGAAVLAAGRRADRALPEQRHHTLPGLVFGE